jgi:hypothetical protein
VSHRALLVPAFRGLAAATYSRAPLRNVSRHTRITAAAQPNGSRFALTPPQRRCFTPHSISSAMGVHATLGDSARVVGTP